MDGAADRSLRSPCASPSHNTDGFGRGVMRAQRHPIHRNSKEEENEEFLAGRSGEDDLELKRRSVDVATDRSPRSASVSFPRHGRSWSRRHAWDLQIRHEERDKLRRGGGQRETRIGTPDATQSIEIPKPCRFVASPRHSADGTVGRPGSRCLHQRSYSPQSCHLPSNGSI